MRIVRYTLAALVGLGAYLLAFQRPYTLTIFAKAAGANEPCSWSKLLRLPWLAEEFETMKREAMGTLHADAEDPALGIVRISTPLRPFWIKKDGAAMDGKALLAFVLAEEDWIVGAEPRGAVHRGDVVVDVGAHIGTFGADALRRGAAKVVMVEPDPVNIECIRRNFASEIASGQVVVVTEGAWSKTDTLEFARGVANSGSGSIVNVESNAQKIRVPVRPLDDMLQSIGVDRVDLIKMDIEGAEREALRGAAKTLAKWKPRLFLDAYHLDDDDVVLPKIITAANPAYRPLCAVCTLTRDSKRIIPYAIFWQ